MELLIRDISKSFEQQCVLRNISFNIPEGTLLLVYGSNGSGKTTLLRILNLLEEPDNGEIIFNDSGLYFFKRVARKNLLIKKKMVFVPQKPVVFNGSVLDNLFVGLKLRKLTIEDKRVEEIIEKFGLKHIKEKKANQLSIGQKQRVSIARSFILDCKLVLLDEPLNYLDEDGKRTIKEYICGEVANGVSFVISTPDLKEWEDFSFDKIFLLKEGFLYDITSKSTKDSME